VVIISSEETADDARWVSVRLDGLGFEAQLDAMLARYGSTLNGAHWILFQLVDLARKVVGVGSVGTRCWIFLFTARDGTEPAAAAGQGGTAVCARRVRRPQQV